MHTIKSCPDKRIRKIKNSLKAGNLKGICEIIEKSNIEISFENYYIFRNLNKNRKLNLDNLYILEKLILMSWNNMSDEIKHKNIKICLKNIGHYIICCLHIRFELNDLSLSLISVMEEILSTGYRPDIFEYPFYLLFRNSAYNRKLNQNEGIFVTLKGLFYKYYDFDDYLSKIDEKEMDRLTQNHEMAFDIVERNPEIAINHPTYMELLIDCCLNDIYGDDNKYFIYFRFLLSTYTKKQILPKLLDMWINFAYNSIGNYNRNNGQFDFEVDFFKDLHKFVNGGTFDLVTLPITTYSIRNIGMAKFSEWRYDLGDLNVKGFNDLLNDHYEIDKFEGTRYAVSDEVLTKMVIDIFTDLQIVFINISWVEILEIFYFLCPSWFERVCKKDNDMIERRLQRIHTYSKKFTINLQ
tara:strand:- start:329 stop:1558 length:1230 start_codon:yes stop_codon:yes gene_type:complete